MPHFLIKNPKCIKYNVVYFIKQNMKKFLIICGIILWLCIVYHFIKWNHKEYIEYYDNGNPKIKINVLNGKLDWEWTIYYENGNIQWIWNYKEWEMDWEWTLYNENGYVVMRWNMNDWKHEWERITYYENGNIQSKQYYKMFFI